MFNINFNFLKGLHQPAPRYTSYPTIVNWEASSDYGYIALKKLAKESSPFLYTSIFPFANLCACIVDVPLS